MTYNGDWLNGEKEGNGEVFYGRRNATESYYKGQWKQSLRHGTGELMLRNGSLIKGNFYGNKPNGDCTI
jgi:hypothetical protein